ncbi:MAG: hypothetical protein JHC95_03550 [Solirubrobacteraceae bacterium]|nr:hypothetical protein [Solirubrobacteraceae bacterium]
MSRRLVLVLAAPALLLPATAAPAATRAKPAFAVRAATVSGATTKVKLGVSFTASSAKACDGSVKVKVKKRAASGKLAFAKKACTASVSLKLPKASFGAKVAFTFSFKGNDAVAPFKVTKSLKVLPPPVPIDSGASSAPQTPVGPPSPPPPPAPPLPDPPAVIPTTPMALVAKGTWGTDEPTVGPDDRFKFSVLSDGSISDITPFGGFKWFCGAPPVSTFATFPFHSTMSVAGSNATQQTYHYVNGKTNVDYTFTLTFDVSSGTQQTGAVLGSGKLHAQGAWDYGAATPESCSVDLDFTMYHYGPFPA